ncbi:ferritin-like domain-containing protein [Halogeometricum sp. S1BR25-6]|uniref:Ferritin-like domain-containing protein n=1 Tax=Halogeometricum salsisoli TaxID=2950536 RepID=A0ABU2GGB7_9EURY|nr:ferritin-like domain-containing protein [Halogeometricum sp. S1BR25-6]MDS0299835.1 ferritin-like domain-containing protein [Halogeometricum sp. S1BR25-6]
MTNEDNTEDGTNGSPFGAGVESVQEAVTSRRGFLAGSTAAGLGALAFGTSGVAADNHQGNGNGNGKGSGEGSENSEGATEIAGSGIWDVDVLNYALTLEHLEDAFYQHNLKSLGGFYSYETITGSGMISHLPSAAQEAVYEHLTTIGEHEAAHVETLEQVITDLGGTPVEKAEYEFGTMVTDDPTAFLETGMALENTGVAAYAGAAPYIGSDDLLSAALGIHSVEARHAAFLNALNGATPFPNVVDEAKGRAEVLEVATQFIVD